MENKTGNYEVYEGELEQADFEHEMEDAEDGLTCEACGNTTGTCVHAC